LATTHGHLKKKGNLSLNGKFPINRTIEAPLYNHLDEPNGPWKMIPIFTKYKEDFISENGIAVWEKSRLCAFTFQVRWSGPRPGKL